MFEAISAAVLLLTAVIFAQSITAVTPLTASTASQQVENQQGELAKSFLAVINETGLLRDTLTYWDESESEFHNSSPGLIIGYRGEAPPNQFGNEIEDYFISEGIGVKMDITYYEENTSGELEQETIPYIDIGVPSDHAHRASTTIEIYDDDPIIAEDGTETSQTVSDVSNFYLEDVSPDSNLYNTVTVEITVWQI